MNATDLDLVMDSILGFWPSTERWLTNAPAMRRLWRQTLARYEHAAVVEALEAWAKTQKMAPTLDNLEAKLEDLATAKTGRRSPTTGSTHDVLVEQMRAWAARAHTPEDLAWGRAHLRAFTQLAGKAAGERATVLRRMYTQLQRETPALAGDCQEALSALAVAPDAVQPAVRSAVDQAWAQYERLPAPQQAALQAALMARLTETYGADMAEQAAKDPRTLRSLLIELMWEKEHGV